MTSPAIISKLLLIGLLITIILLSAILVWYNLANLSTGNQAISETSTSFAATNTENTTSLTLVLSSLAYEHWSSIAQRNLTAVMSQYSTEYEALWWDANGSAVLESLNGKHDCNLPNGPGNCSGVVSSAWNEFFNYSSSSMKFTVCGLNISTGEPGNAFAVAIIWYFLPNANETIRAPYQIDFRIMGEQWQLLRDTFGFPGNPADVIPGFVMPSCASTLKTNG